MYSLCGNRSVALIQETRSHVVPPEIHSLFSRFTARFFVFLVGETTKCNFKLGILNEVVCQYTHYSN